jgi:hypothetical protein
LIMNVYVFYTLVSEFKEALSLEDTLICFLKFWAHTCSYCVQAIYVLGASHAIISVVTASRRWLAQINCVLSCTFTKHSAKVGMH